MNVLFSRKVVIPLVLGALVFGGVRCVGSLTADSLRASHELQRGLNK